MAENTFKIKTRDGFRELSEEQLIALAQKASDVLPEVQSKYDKLVAETKDLRTDHDAALSFLSDFKAVINNEEGAREAAARLGSAVGWDESDIEDILGAGDEPAKPAGRPTRRVKDEKEEDDENEEDDTEQYFREDRRMAQPANNRKLSLTDLDPELQRDIKQLRQNRIADTREFMFSQVKSALAQDGEIGKLMKNEKLAQVINKLGTETLRRRVGLDGQEFGPRTINEVLGEVKEFIKEAGIQSPEDKPKSLAALGLGPSAESIADVLHREQPPQRESVSSGDDKYRRNLFERMAHHITRKGGLTDTEVDDGADDLEEEGLG